MRILLEHGTGECTGRWELRNRFLGLPWTGWWCCSRCARAYPSCASVDAAARRENEHAEALIAAGIMGAHLLAEAARIRLRWRRVP